MEEWVKKQLLKIVEGYECKEVYNADATGLFCRLLCYKTLSLKGDHCKTGRNSKVRITVLLPCNAGGTGRLPLVFNCGGGNTH